MLGGSRLAVLATTVWCAPLAQAQTVVPPRVEAPMFPSATTDAIANGLAEDARDRLSSRLALDAFTLMRTPGVTAQEIDVAADMTRLAAELTPDRVESWQDVLAMADLIGPGEEWAARWRDKAVAKLSAMQPANSVLLLRRLAAAISSKQTAEARIKAFDVSLSPTYVKSLPGPVASRLALDAGYLLNRLGDAPGFESYLITSCTLDPANPVSTELRAGLAASIDTPEVAATDLASAINANPASYQLYSRLCRLLMSQGAYEGARRMARNADRAVAPQFGLLGFEVTTPIVVERCLTEWAAGSTEQARRRLHEYDELWRGGLRAFARQRGMSGSAADIESLGIAPVTEVEVLRLALEMADESLASLPAADGTAPSADATTKRRDAVDAARREALEGLDAQARSIAGHTAAGIAAKAGPLLLGAQLCAASLGSEATTRNWIAKVEAIAPLDAKTLARFDGWIALKKGDATTALEHFKQADADAPLTRLGMAEAQRLLGDSAASLDLLASLARQDAAGPIGLLARTRWQVQSKKPLMAPKADAFERIAASVPVYWDAVLRNEQRPLLLDGEPVKSNLRPFDPMRVRVTLTNTSPYPLAIESGGPIDVAVALQPTRLQDGTMNEPPCIVQMDGALVLAPGAKVTTESDLRRWPVGLLVEQKPLVSASITFRAVSNPVYVGRGASVGALGAESLIEPMVIAAPVTNDSWIESQLHAIRNPDTAGDLLSAALLMWVGARAEADEKDYADAVVNAEAAAAAASQAHRLAYLEAVKEAQAKGTEAPTEPEPVPPEVIDPSKWPYAKWKDAVWHGITESIVRMPNEAQAWMLLVSPGRSDGMDSVRAAVRANDDAVVRLCYLYGAIVAVDDPVLAQELASTDPVRANRAQALQSMLRRNLQGALDLRKRERGGREFDPAAPAPTGQGGAPTP